MSSHSASKGVVVFCGILMISGAGGRGENGDLYVQNSSHNRLTRNIGMRLDA